MDSTRSASRFIRGSACAGQGFPIALGAGIGGTFFALFAASASLGKYYPWLLPMNIFVEGRFVMALVLGIGGGIVAALLGCFEFMRRDVM